MATINLQVEEHELDTIFRTFQSVDPTSMFDVIQLLRQKLLIQASAQLSPNGTAPEEAIEEAPDGGQDNQVRADSTGD